MRAVEGCDTRPALQLHQDIGDASSRRGGDPPRPALVLRRYRLGLGLRSRAARSSDLGSRRCSSDLEEVVGWPTRSAEVLLVLLHIAGSSCAGKTTTSPALRDLPALVVRDFDEMGVPRGADTAWRQSTMERWVQFALEQQAVSVDVVLADQSPLGEVLAVPFRAQPRRVPRGLPVRRLLAAATGRTCSAGWR